MKHLYYKNDFAVEITLLNASGEPTAPPVWDWSVEFSDGRRSYVCALKKGNAKVVDKKIICYLDRHMLGCGVITYKFVQTIPNVNYADGYQTIISPKSLPVELWEKESDDDSNIQSEIVPNYAVYDAYMIAKQNGYEGTAEKFYQGFNNNERGNIYLDINDSTKLRVLGAERYLNDEYVPFIFRKTRKANSYRVQENGELVRYQEKTRKGWHPMGQIGQCAVDKNGVVSVRKDVFQNGKSKEMSTRPEYFVKGGWLVRGSVQEGGSNTTVPYGRSKIELEKECVEDETTGMRRTKWRRVRLLYGIAFIKKKYVDKVTRLDLSRLATNIATFHLCWDGSQYVPEGNLEKWSDNFHWIFNK